MFACDYGTGWLGINSVVILVAFFVITLVYLLSRALPVATRAKITGVVKIELTQVLISVFILVVLFSITSALCLTTISIGQMVAQPPPQQQYSSQVPFPALQVPTVSAATIATGDPFAYSESYVGNYAFYIGPSLGIQVYAYSYSYSILAGVWSNIGGSVASALSPLSLFSGSFLSVTTPVAIDLGIPYSILGDLYLDIFGPLVILGIGIMLMQYLVLIASQYAAFAIILPIALVMRSVAFSGGTLRSGANSILAVAIGLYIIYPVMIVFNSYIIHWMFTSCIGGVVTTSCNPSALYLQQNTYNHDSISMLLLAGKSQTLNYNVYGIPISLPTFQDIVGDFQLAYGSAANGLTSIFGYNGDQATLGIQGILLEISEYMFVVIVLFAINLTVTVGFSMGLTKALNGGVEGAASFWGSL
jgi:hypothetical protein